MRPNCKKVALGQPKLKILVSICLVLLVEFWECVVTKEKKAGEQPLGKISLEITHNLMIEIHLTKVNKREKRMKIRILWLTLKKSKKEGVCYIAILKILQPDR